MNFSIWARYSGSSRGWLGGPKWAKNGFPGRFGLPDCNFGPATGYGLVHRIRSVSFNPGHSMSTCTRCKKPLPADAMGGVCPACLLGLARPERLDPALQATRDQREPDPSKYPTPAELGRWLPQYRIDELIGQGGMGAVYRGHQPSLDRPVAIKVMSPRFADDPSFAERFSREARTMARLNHQNIINVHDYGQAGPVCYLVMEFVEGVNLRRAMQNGELTAEQALAIVPQVCEALQFAHDEGIVHRDIKPENILLDRRGRVKIADFGLAKLVQEDSPQWTLTGSRQVLGTANYMAPEQIERPGTVDHRADIYSLGVVFYELLTGELPLGRFPLPSEKSRATAALDEVVLRSLEKEPQRRYQQASEVRSAVELVRNSSGFRPLGEPGVQSPPVPPAAFAPQAAPAAWASSPAKPAAAGSGSFRFRVPFTVEDPNWGMTVTHGTIKLQDQRLLIDYATQDNVFHAIPIGSGQHEIGLAEVLQADFREGYFSGRLTLVLDRLQPLSGLPSEKPGKILFTVASDDKHQARELVNSLRQNLGQPPLPGTSDKPADLRKAAVKAVGWPATGLIIAGVINLIMVPLVYMAGAMSQVKDSVMHLNLQFTLWTILVCLALILLGGLLVSGGVSMLRLRRRGWAIAMAIMALLPVHPGALVGLPAGIIALVQLARSSVAREFDQPVMPA